MVKIGTLFAGRYGIISKAGSGGMADVYKAQDVQEKRLVALKVLKDSLSQNHDAIKAFREEGERAAEIQNQNVVKVYETNCFNGTHYIVMEYVDGITLKEYIQRKGHLSAKETMAITGHIAYALRAAHSKQIVHRDVKPQNVLLSRDGSVKVTDFGIAGSTTGDRLQNLNTGSVYYMAPEQAKSENCDERSDIYSLGIVMYEMVTGRVPFDKETSVEVMLAHMNESMTAPSKLNPECPLALEQIIFRCTQKSASRRYHNCTELLGDLKIAINNPDYDFGQKEKATILKSSTQVFSKNNTQKNAHQAVIGGAQTSREADIEDKNSSKNEAVPKTFFDRVLTVFGMLVGAVCIVLLIYIIVSLSGCLTNQGGNSGTRTQAESTQESTTEEELTFETKYESDFNEETDAKVPNVIGMEMMKAVEELQSAGLNYKLSSAIEYSDEYPLGTVMLQSYEGGTILAKGSTIVILISAGSDKFVVKKSYLYARVTDIKGDLAKYSDIITAEFKTFYDDTKTINYVYKIEVDGVDLGSSATDITATKGSTVVVTYCLGAELGKVPDVVGKSVEQAAALIQKAGFNYTVVEDENATGAKGVVLRTDPMAGGTLVKITDVEKRKVVKLYVAKGSGYSGTTEAETETTAPTTESTAPTTEPTTESTAPSTEPTEPATEPTTSSEAPEPQPEPGE